MSLEHTPGSSGQGRRVELRVFATFTSSLEELADWLAANGVGEVVMEATGPYWKPVWYVLEDRGFDLKLVNARHVKMVPGRKTDMADAAWLAELLEHGLLRSSFVPPPAIRELRDLTRYRKRLIQTHTAEQQRVQKTLEDAGIKLDSVASDIFGVSGRQMLAALIAGERTRGAGRAGQGGGLGHSYEGGHSPPGVTSTSMASKSSPLTSRPSSSSVGRRLRRCRCGRRRRRAPR